MSTHLRNSILAAAGVAAFALLEFFVATKPRVPAEKPIASIEVDRLSFGKLKGWRKDDLLASIAPFKRSCDRLRNFAASDTENPALDLSGASDDVIATLASRPVWAKQCQRVQNDLSGVETNRQARRFFEQNFVPIRITQDGASPLFTGYFEPSYEARTEPQSRFTAPVLTKPKDLSVINLGKFDDRLDGKRITGRISGNTFVPYQNHESIIQSPPSSSDVLGFMDPNDLLFLQIQGSGQLVYDDGRIDRIGYAAQNGHRYVAIGRTLVKDGHLALEDVSMQSIYDWLETADPDAAADIRYSNPSYVFFHKLENLPEPSLGPLGAQSVQLTPNRSLAIDSRYYAYGAPIWLETKATDQTPSLKQLMIAQDTGGAIKGVQRGDIFFGAGDDAALHAGKLKTEGSITVLVPKFLFED